MSILGAGGPALRHARTRASAATPSSGCRAASCSRPPPASPPARRRSCAASSPCRCWGCRGGVRARLDQRSRPAAINGAGAPHARRCFALLLFLLRLALDAQGGDRTGAQALDADRLAALLADAVDAVLDALQRLLDLADQLALAVADSQRGVAVRLEGRAIGRLGKVLLAVRPCRSPSAPPRRATPPPAGEQILEPVQIAVDSSRRTSRETSSLPA